MIIAITSCSSSFAVSRNGKLLKGSEAIYWNINESGTLRIESASQNCPDFKTSPFYKYRKKITRIEFDDNGWDSNLENIGDNMFKGLDHVTTVELPSTIKIIGSGAFENCTSLLDVNIPMGTIEIMPSAFKNCTSMSGLRFESFNLKSIGHNAFENCVSLMHVDIPESVEFIGKNALRGCSGLEALSLPFIGADGSVWVTNSEKNYIGWIFGKNKGVQYYEVCQSIGTNNNLVCNLPVSLTSISVKGGYVYKDTFNNCDIDKVTLGDDVMAMPTSIAVAQYGNTKLFSQL